MDEPVSESLPFPYVRQQTLVILRKPANRFVAEVRFANAALVIRRKTSEACHVIHCRQHNEWIARCLHITNDCLHILRKIGDRHVGAHIVQPVAENKEVWIQINDIGLVTFQCARLGGLLIAGATRLDCICPDPFITQRRQVYIGNRCT